jgi:hypothetical protein
VQRPVMQYEWQVKLSSGLQPVMQGRCEQQVSSGHQLLRYRNAGYRTKLETTLCAFAEKRVASGAKILLVC